MHCKLFNNQKFLSLRDWWKTGVTKQVCFSEGIVFSGVAQALLRTGYWEQVGAMHCNMQCKLCAHCNLPLESAAHCEPWGGLHVNWSVFAHPDGAAELSLAQRLMGHGLMLAQWWFTYLYGKGKNNHNHQADHLLCLMFLKPQISSTAYLDLYKGKVFPVCIVQMRVTICLKLGNIICMFSPVFLMLFFTVLCEMSRVAYSTEPKSWIFSFVPLVLLLLYNQMWKPAQEEDKYFLRYCHIFRM